MDSSFKFSVESSKLELLISPITLPYSQRRGIGKLEVSSAGIVITVSSKFDPAEPVDSLVWVKADAFIDFDLPSEEPITMAVNVHEFHNIVSMCTASLRPRWDLLIVEKVPQQNSISFFSSDWERVELEILPTPLPDIEDTPFIEGSRCKMSLRRLNRLSTSLFLFKKKNSQNSQRFPEVSILVHAYNQECTILPPVNHWDAPLVRPVPYSYGVKITFKCPDMLMDACKLPLTEATISRLSSHSVLLELHAGPNASVANLKFVFECSFF